MRPILRLLSRLLSRLLPRLILRLVALLRRAATRSKINRTRARHWRELSGMSSQELNDLGIGRGEIGALTK